MRHQGLGWLGVLAFAGGCTEYGHVELAVYDHFVQRDNDARADVLFVVDDSASMTEEQARLQNNFIAFIDVMDDTTADFQVGVVSTDADGPEGGLLRGGILTPETPDLVTAAAYAFSVGTKGSRDEKGLKAAALALDGRNPDFRRPGARLNIVAVSDEDDHSNGETNDWLAFFGDAAGEDAFALHSIVGDLPDGCASGTSAADAGFRYVEASAVTQGWRESICNDDYTDILTRIGLDVAGLDDRFPLSKVADSTTLEVWVDDVRIPERDADGWYYDPADNSVVFVGRSIPRAGMQVGVHYKELLGADAPND